MLTSSGIASKEILAALFFAEPSNWRLRQVLQISPLTHDSYRARTSFQFLIHRAFLEAAWNRAFADTPAPPDLPESEIEIVIPIDYLPKYVLLDFSLEGPDAKPLSLFTSRATSAISVEIFRQFTEELDESLADGQRTAQQFTNNHSDIITCLISTGQNDVARALDSFGWSTGRVPTRSDFKNGVAVLYESLTQRLTGDRHASATFQYTLMTRCAKFYEVIAGLPASLCDAVGEDNPYWSLFLNPALLIADFLNIRGVVVPTDADVAEFFDLCHAYLGGLVDLQDDKERFDYLTRFLSKLTYLYVAYARVKVPIDRDFMIKMDQIIPMEIKWWRRFTGGLRYQNYLIGVGGSRSTHIEVSCEHPIELEQRPKRSRVVVGNRKVPVESVFSVGSHSTRYHQHFYTNRSIAEARRAISAAGGRLRGQGYLWLRVYYTVEAGTIYGYRLVSALALAALVLFVRLYEPSKFSPGQAQFVTVIPFLSGFLGALAALRPQENVVAIRVRKHKLFVLGLVALTLLHFMAGLLYPWWAEAVRNWIGGLPFVGRLVL